MKLISARDSRAPAPLSTANRAPAIRAAALEVEDAERRPEVPVRLRLEVERARLAVPAHLDVVGGALAHRHAGVRQVRQHQQRLRRAAASIASSSALELLDLLRRARGWLPESARGVLALRAWRARSPRPTAFCSRLSPSTSGMQPAARRLERGELLERARRGRGRGCGARSRTHVEMIAHEARDRAWQSVGCLQTIADC